MPCTSPGYEILCIIVPLLFSHGELGFITIIPLNSHHRFGIVVRLVSIKKLHADPEQRQWNLLPYWKPLHYISSHRATSPYQSLYPNVVHLGLPTFNSILNGSCCIDLIVHDTASNSTPHLPTWSFPNKYNHQTRNLMYLHILIHQIVACTISECRSEKNPLKSRV